MPRTIRTRPMPRRTRGTAGGPGTCPPTRPRAPPRIPKIANHAEDGGAAEERAPPEACGLPALPAQVVGSVCGKHGEGTGVEERQDAGSIGEAKQDDIDHSR